jgi:transcriptional regulator with XRE-family HTH domain
MGRSLPRSYRASNEGFKKAEAAFKLKGWTQDYLAGSAGCTRQVVINFFAKRPVEKRLFQNICNELGLEWGGVADFEAEEQLSGSSMDTAQKKKEGVERKSKAIFVLSGTIDTVDQAKLKAIQEHLRTISGDVNLTITNTESGSIKITLEGSPEGLERLKELFESGELNEVLDIPIEDVQLVTGETSEDNENTEDDKSRPDQDNAVQKSESQSQTLSGNPIGVKFILTNLIRGNLNGAFRILTSLIRADLSGANLRGTNLSGAHLRGTNLSGANLSGANLIGANLSGAIVEHALFGRSVGLTEEMKRDLEQRGAIFGDRPEVPSST